ncbi:hypothetical protein AWB77_02217 [Caballeronia fortuita]|uniref:Uncharacterized protein n=1 Tax=Caballeronia fortuita TaxID=1777138 RepID=A0A158AZK4_9BURK|nr:hypothetical protein [Caballeronia fortuita]SAK62886.1 hypothetical protein AWB77_02217 [Caballeronia fortuita]
MTDQRNKDSNPEPPASLERPFRLFAVEQRVLAQNVDGKVIDIGAMDSKNGEFRACMDSGDIATEPKRSPELALKALVEKLSFDYLDGLFTSEREAEVSGRLQDYPNIEFELDETLPRDMTDRRPPHLF